MTPFHLQFVLKVTHSLRNTDIDRIPFVTFQQWELVKKVHLSRIGSQPRALQRAIEEVSTLPLSPPEGGLKSEFAVFVNKIQLIVE